MVLGTCQAKRDTEGFVRFLDQIDLATEADQAIHVILDNLSTHKSPPVQHWLAAHPPRHLPQRSGAHRGHRGLPAALQRGAQGPSPPTSFWINSHDVLKRQTHETSHQQFVYVAGAHGVVAVDDALENAIGPVDYRTLPRVTFTTPNIASVGMTDAEAREAGIGCQCRTVPLSLVPRALVNRDTRGVVKIVAESESGIVREVHMLAANAGDSILAGVYAIESRMTVHQMANIWCPYLTISEGIKLAAQAFTMDVLKLSCCGA